MSEESGEVFCSRHWSDEDKEDAYLLTFYRVIIFSLIFLTITATLGNSLILVALRNDSASLHPPSRLLLRSLTITDLCVGIISQPLFITYIIVTLTENWNLCRVIQYSIFVVNTIFPGVSLFTLTAIGVDRLLALLLRLRYRQVVTVKRVRVVIFLFWLTGSVVGIIYVWSVHLFFIVSGVVVLLFVTISTFSYTVMISNLSYHATSTNTSTRCSWKPKYRTEHGRYKDSFQCIVDSLHVSSMLSSFYCNNGFNNCCRIQQISFLGRSLNSVSSLRQFFTKPVSLLLENERSSSSGEGNG